MNRKPPTSDAQLQSPTPVRLPFELKTWLQHTAIDNRRSLSGEIVYRLEQSRNQQTKEIL